MRVRSVNNYFYENVAACERRLDRLSPRRDRPSFAVTAPAQRRSRCVRALGIRPSVSENSQRRLNIFPPSHVSPGALVNYSDVRRISPSSKSVSD
ncbi:hypothetical protein EVAR_81052_1 [Eumeta japonica]|uniref:Uncharacterized protein n=1 Tax=Eumeta variegata TaxID=151549 RepID=A0A4C1T6F0_EUMVA|nr:hypothetical protein EVAR_81052_1 [Eumeta japonica]